MNANIIVSIEGNIGSGKSTLLHHIQATKMENISDKNIILLKEPIDEWEKIMDENGNTILKLFYENPAEYAFSFQMMAYISRLTNLKKIMEENNNSIIVTERSLFTDRYVFAQMLYDDKKIRPIDFTIYLNWFDSFIKEYPVHKVIYINSSPNICAERILTRSRNGETNISFDYLQNCHKYHENMMKYYNSIITPNNTYIFNGNLNKDNRIHELNNMMSFICLNNIS
jgi:deoxyadenosine/deoxycytidine kinase